MKISGKCHLYLCDICISLFRPTYETYMNNIIHNLAPLRGVGGGCLSTVCERWLVLFMWSTSCLWCLLLWYHCNVVIFSLCCKYFCLWFCFGLICGKSPHFSVAQNIAKVCNQNLQKFLQWWNRCWCSVNQIEQKNPSQLRIFTKMLFFNSLVLRHAFQDEFWKFKGGGYYY